MCTFSITYFYRVPHYSTETNFLYLYRLYKNQNKFATALEVLYFPNLVFLAFPPFIVNLLELIIADKIIINHKISNARSNSLNLRNDICTLHPLEIGGYQLLNSTETIYVTF